MFCGHVKFEHRNSKEDPVLLLYGILEISIDLFGCQCAGGDERARTADPLLAKQVLSQLSYIPWATAKPWLLAARIAPPSACEELFSAGGCQTLKV